MSVDGGTMVPDGRERAALASTDIGNSLFPRFFLVCVYFVRRHRLNSLFQARN